MFYLLYLSYLLEIIRCPFSNGPFATHAVSYSLLRSVSHSFNLCLSISLSRSSAYSPLCFYLLPFYVNGNWLVWWSSLNKFISTSVVPCFGFAHNKCCQNNTNTVVRMILRIMLRRLMKRTIIRINVRMNARIFWRIFENFNPVFFSHKSWDHPTRN